MGVANEQWRSWRHDGAKVVPSSDRIPLTYVTWPVHMREVAAWNATAEPRFPGWPLTAGHSRRRSKYSNLAIVGEDQVRACLSA